MNMQRRIKIYLGMLAIAVLINLKGVFSATASVEKAIYGVVIYTLVIVFIAALIEGSILFCKLANKLINKIRN